MWCGIIEYAFRENLTCILCICVELLIFLGAHIRFHAGLFFVVSSCGVGGGGGGCMMH